MKTKYMIRMLTYKETANSKKDGVPTELTSDFVGDSNMSTSKRIDFLTVKSTLLKFDSEEEAANHIKDKLYHFVKTAMFEIVKVYI